MGRYAADYLEPSSAIGEYSIGADFVQYPQNPEYVTHGIATLRSSLSELVESEDRDSLATASRINRYFNRNDHWLAERNLSDKLHKPFYGEVVEWLANACDHDMQIFCR